MTKDKQQCDIVVSKEFINEPYSQKFIERKIQDAFKGEHSGYLVEPNDIVLGYTYKVYKGVEPASIYINDHISLINRKVAEIKELNKHAILIDEKAGYCQDDFERNRYTHVLKYRFS